MTASRSRKTTPHKERSLKAKPRKTRPGVWARWSDERLLDMRLCDLGLEIEGTWLQEMVERLYGELADRCLRIRPHFWLSDEWFCPKGVPGVAIPFYLAHPRLLKLERDQMFEVEGGTRKDCMKLLRHEVGHAVQNAYQLHRRRNWQLHFGKASEPYPSAYRPNPFTKDFVQHLDDFYAQSHPEEDFAETFAVWLNPRSGWRRRYRGWEAITKLEYVDQLMGRLVHQKMSARSRARPDALPSQRQTLREHYEARHDRYVVDYSEVYDRDLYLLFEDPASVDHAASEPATVFLRRHRKALREAVSRWSGEYQYTLNQVLSDVTGRCRELGLRASGPERQLKLDCATMLTVHVMHNLFVHREWRYL